MNRSVRGVTILALALSGCEDTIDLDPLDETPPIEARVRPQPISGGTLLVTPGGLAVAADPDRDLVYVVDLAASAVRHAIPLEAGDEPGRVVQGTDDLAHVVLRGFGGVATLDLSTGTIVSRRRVCPEPRGILFDEDDASLRVACAGGALVQLDETTGQELDRLRLDPDLRDVVKVDGEIFASTFRAASLARTDGTYRFVPDSGAFEPRVAWRTWVDPDKGLVMLHQLSDTDPVRVDLDADDVAGGDNLPYGGGDTSCQPGLTDVALTVFGRGSPSTIRAFDAALTVDAAFDPTTDMIALAMPGAEAGSKTVHFVFEGEGCFVDDTQDDADNDDGQVTSVAFLPDGTLVMQSREPARLLVQRTPPYGPVENIELPGESRFDTGHEIFHRATESGLSCASCHPEGTDDGHVWRFEGLGKRRTQPLDVGLAGTAPFHWDGDMEDVDMLMSEVLAHRMGGTRHSADRRASFKRWMFELERPPADAGLDAPELVADGEALFGSYGCDRCHTGAKLGGTGTHSIWDVPLQVPALRRVSLRPPFMHDGRLPTLNDAMRDMIASTTDATPSDHDIEALSAYMRTL